MQAVVVTGDSRGLGAEIIKKLLQDEPYNIIGLSRNKNEQIRVFESEYPERFTHVNFDLSKPDSIQDLYKSDLKPQGPIYGLINNAAIAYDDLVTNATLEDINALFQVNVFSPILLSKFALRDMVLNKTEGSIIHVSSVSTSTGYKGLSMYGASKAALEAFSLGVAREWGERGIRSNCVAPGFMNTEMTSSLDEDEKNRIYDRTGLGEPTDPKSVAEAVLFLLSDAATSITGEVVRIDAGTL